MNRKRPPQKLPKILTKPEEEAFRSVVSGARDEIAISLMLDTGLRVSEATKLEIGNVDWNEQLLRFFGKGGKEAELPIPQRLREAFEKADIARPILAGHDYILWSKTRPSKGISRYALNKLVESYGKKAGIAKKVHPHMLRHTLGTNLYKATRDLAIVQKALRHSRPNTVYIYVHLAAEDLREDMDSLDKRPWFIRKWERSKPLRFLESFKSQKEPFFIGEIIGREKELERFRINQKACLHSVVMGERGMGKRTLLSQISGEGTIHIERFSPVRDSLVRICEKLHKDGLLESIPKGRSSDPFLNALREVGKEHDLLLVVDSIKV